MSHAGGSSSSAVRRRFARNSQVSLGLKRGYSLSSVTFVATGYVVGGNGQELPPDATCGERGGRVTGTSPRRAAALGYLRPADYYRGSHAQLQAARRTKLAQARHRSREKNLALRQPTLPLKEDSSAL
jgi:hypothetical protein